MPDSAFKDGASVAVPTTIGNLDSIATTLPDAANLVIVIVQLDNTNAAARDIIAGNLEVRRGTLTTDPLIAETEDLIRLEAAGGETETKFAYLVARDATPGANPTYGTFGAASGTGVDSETKFLILNDMAHSAGADGTLTQIGAGETTLATLTTTFPAATAAQPHILIAACHLNVAVVGERLEAGVFRIKNGATVLAVTQLGIEMRESDTTRATMWLLVAEDPNGIANDTYTVTVQNDRGAEGEAEAKIIGIAGHDADLVDTAHVAVGTTRTVIGSLATTFAVGDDVLVAGFQNNSVDAVTAPVYPAAGIDCRLSGDATTDADNQFGQTYPPDGGRGEGGSAGLVNKITTTVANPTYEGGALANVALDGQLELKMVAIHVADAAVDDFFGAFAGRQPARLPQWSDYKVVSY